MPATKLSVEYRNALIKAKEYFEQQHLSKEEIYERLVSESGDAFEEEAARYAVENLNSETGQTGFMQNVFIKEETGYEEKFSCTTAFYESTVNDTDDAEDNEARAAEDNSEEIIKENIAHDATDTFDEKEKQDALSPDSRQTAVKDARERALRSCSSKQNMYEWLTSELYCNYPEEDAQYILAHIDIDYKQQALAEAQYLATGKAMRFSKKGILKLLATKGFTQEEIRYAIENLNVDFKLVALAQAESEARESHFSKEKTQECLTAYKFTDEEVAYAMANLTFNDFKGNALYMAQWQLEEYHYPKELLCEKLIVRDLFTKEEATYAIDHLDETIAETNKVKTED